jgi:hypothetical protein
MTSELLKSIQNQRLMVSKVLESMLNKEQHNVSQLEINLFPKKGRIRI